MISFSAFFWYIFLPLAIIGWGVYFVLKEKLKNRIVVAHDKQERVVIREKNTGRLRVLGAGTHYPTPNWREDFRVDLNQHPRDLNGLTVITRDGIELLVDFRFTVLLGRDFNKLNGQLTSPKKDIIKDENVLEAVTITDYDKREAFVDGEFSGTVDPIFRGYRYEELILPDQQSPHIKIPRQDIIYGDINDPDGHYILRAEDAPDGAAVFRLLEKLIYRQVNYNLRDVGFNIAEVRIKDMKPKDPEMQRAQDRVGKVSRLVAATQKIPGTGLTEREKFAVGTAEFGSVTQAEATRAAGESFSEGMKFLAEGLRRFGKGSGNQQNNP